MSKLNRSICILIILSSMSMAEGMYYGGGLNSMDLGLKDNAIGIEAKVGKIFSNNFGIEGQISKTFSSAEENYDNLNLEIDVMAISVFATYSHQLTPQLTIMPKIGFTQYSMDASISSVNEDDNALGLSIGVDLKYHVTNNMNIYTSFSKYYPKLDKDIATINFTDGTHSFLSFNKDVSPTHLSIGIEQKF